MQPSPSNAGAPFARVLPWLLLACGGIGLAAAFVLAVEKIALLENPAYVPTCSINPVLSCGSVMSKPQAEAFGFPNPLIGIAGFAVVLAIGAALLAGAQLKLKRWFWLGLQAGVLFGIGFVHWLMYQSMQSIGALCPYCMVVWTVMIPLFWYVTLHNLGSMRRRPRILQIILDYHGVILSIWYLAIITWIGFRFWSYWSTLL